MILQTEEEKLQENLFIITGVFGGVALILCLMILVLSFNLSKYVSQSVSQEVPALTPCPQVEQGGEGGEEERQAGWSARA